MSMVAVIFPEADLRTVEQFRARWDPLAESVAAHITVVFPFPESVDLGSIRNLTMRPFRVRLSNPSVWESGYLFLTATTGREQVVDLHRRSYQALELPAPPNFIPHMTIGRRPPGTEMGLMLADAADLAVEGFARSLTIYRRHADGRRSIEHTVGRGAGPRRQRRDGIATQDRRYVIDPDSTPSSAG